LISLLTEQPLKNPPSTVLSSFLGHLEAMDENAGSDGQSTGERAHALDARLERLVVSD